MEIIQKKQLLLKVILGTSIKLNMEREDFMDVINSIIGIDKEYDEFKDFSQNVIDEANEILKTK